jgi:hypothetical protein
MPRIAADQEAHLAASGVTRTGNAGTTTRISSNPIEQAPPKRNADDDQQYERGKDQANNHHGASNQFHAKIVLAFINGAGLTGVPECMRLIEKTPVHTPAGPGCPQHNAIAAIEGSS